MTENGDGGAPQTPNPAGESRFAIQKIYVKDLSFETPNSPDIFRTEWRPSVEMQIFTESQPLGEGSYEVTLRITVTVKVQERTAFLAEVHQSGIFAISGVPDEHMHPMLGVFCPNILFPYARETISDLVTRGGFPQLLLAPVNFDALYAQQQQQAQQAAAQEGGEQAAEPETPPQSTH